MKRKWIGLCVFLLLSYVALSMYFGIIIEKELKETTKSLQVVADDDHSFFQAVFYRKYKKGIFSSNVVLRIINGRSARSRPKIYDFDVTIYHGPFIFPRLQFGSLYATTQLRLPKETINSLNSIISQDAVLPQLNLSLFKSFTNKMSFQAVVPQSHLTVQGDFGNVIKAAKLGKFAWGGLIITQDITLKNENGANLDQRVALSSMVGNVVFKKLAISNSEGMFSTSGFRWRNEAKTSENNQLNLYTQSIDIPFIHLMHQSKKVFGLTRFHFDSSLEDKKGVLTLYAHASTPELIISDENYGKTNIEGVLRGLKVETFVALKRLAIRAGLMNYLSNDFGNEFVKTYQEALYEVLSSGVEVTFTNVRLGLPIGPVKINAVFKAPVGQTNSRLKELKKALIFKGDISVPTVMLEEYLVNLVEVNISQENNVATFQAKQAEEKALELARDTDDMVQVKPPVLKLSDVEIQKEAYDKVSSHMNYLSSLGVLKKQDDHYFFKFELKQGQLFINEEPFSLDMLTLK